jgi:gamma-glutamylcyclotransferase (GGCT)/AIG2-like uncharacterized protein YtfP
MDSRLQNMDSALQDVHIPYEIKAISEELHKEVIEMRRELSKQLDQIEDIFRENRADLRAVEDRIAKIERKLLQ